MNIQPIKPDYEVNLRHIAFHGDTPAEALRKMAQWFEEHPNEFIRDGSYFDADKSLMALSVTNDGIAIGLIYDEWEAREAFTATAMAVNDL
jgi:predicted RNase H-like HicB family nuclease